MSEKTVLYPFHIVAQCSNSAMGSYTADFRRYQDTPEMSVEGINDFYAWFGKERPNTKCVITGIFPLSAVTEIPDIVPAKAEKSHVQMLRELLGEDGMLSVIKDGNTFYVNVSGGLSDCGFSVEDAVSSVYSRSFPGGE